MSAEIDRTHTASRVIKAGPQAIYEAFIRPEKLAVWLPPEGATGDIEVFEPQPGGRFRMTLTFLTAAGKSSRNTDVIEARFRELLPAERIVQTVEFVSDNADDAGTMTMTWSLSPVSDGTLVAVFANHVPPGISRADHELGMTSTLANLAKFVE
jgi:uncharacterized protein YndB with AHSA1/START domain